MTLFLTVVCRCPDAKDEGTRRTGAPQATASWRQPTRMQRSDHHTTSHVHPSRLQEVPVNYLLVNVVLLTRGLFPSGSVHASACRLGCPDDVQHPRCPEVLPSAGVQPSLPPATSAAIPAHVTSHPRILLPWNLSVSLSSYFLCCFSTFSFLPAEFN